MTLVFSLVGGLLVAIALQLVFANLGIAFGLTVLDWSPNKLNKRTQSSEDQDSENKASKDKADKDRATTEGSTKDETASASKSSLPITHFLGFGVAIGFSVSVFLATLLSVEFGQIFEPRRGIIFGLIVWATYWLLFIWLSSTTISGITDSILGSALQGGKQLLTSVKKTAQQTVQTLEENNSPSEDTLTHESVMLQDLVETVSQLSKTQKELPTLLEHQREALVKELTGGNPKAQTSDPQNGNPQDSSSSADLKVETVVDASQPNPSVSTAVSTTPSTLLSRLDLPSWQQILKRSLNQVDLSEWDVETILQQLPVENEAVSYAKSQIVAAATAVLPESKTSDEKPEEEPEERNEDTNSSAEESIHSEHDREAVKAIQAKLISYCRYTNTKLLTPQSLIEKVHAQQEEHGLLNKALSRSAQLDIDAIEAILSKRKKLSHKKKQQLIKTLEKTWSESFIETSKLGTSETEETVSLDVLPTPSLTEKSVDLSLDSSSQPELSIRGATAKAYETLENHLQSVDWAEVSLKDIKPDLGLLLEQMEKKGAIALIDWSALSAHIQLPKSVKAEFMTWLQTAVTHKTQSLGPAIVQRSQSLSHQLIENITHLLHHQQKTALTPAKMTQSLSQVVSSTMTALPEPATLANLSDLSNLWNKQTWQQALEKRKDLTQDEIKQILEWGETVWQPKAEQMGHWLHAIQAEAREQLTLPDADSLAQPIATATHQAIGQLAEAKTNIVEQVNDAKESIAEQVNEVKADIQRQAEAARRQVAIAAWWLFIALVSSGSAAAGAGYLAATY